MDNLKTNISIIQYDQMINEIKLLNYKLDKLQKDYDQLLTNWDTIMCYMKKIDSIEDKVMGRPNPNKIR
jgi:hypothetical protein